MSKNIFIGSVAINVDGDASAADPIDPNQLADIEYVVSTNFMKNKLRDLLADVAMKVNLTAADGADPDDFASYVDSANALRQRVDVVKSTQLVAGKFDLNKLEADVDGDVGKISATLSSFFGDAQGADAIELLDDSGNTTHRIFLDRVNNDADITIASGLPKAIGRQVNIADNDERIFSLMVEPSTLRNLAAFGIRAYGGRDRTFRVSNETKSLSKLIESKSVGMNVDRSFDQLNDVNSSAAPGTRELAHEIIHLLFRDDPPSDVNTTLKKDGEPVDLKKKWIYDADAGTLALNYVEQAFRLQFVVVSELDIVNEGDENVLSSTKASPAGRVVAVDGADAPDNPINPKRVLIRYDFNFDGANEIFGCMDTRARNFFAYANVDDGLCEIEGCTDDNADNFDASADANIDDGSCLYDGCTNARATNYDSNANRDDGSCLINGCMDSRGTNYDSEATVNIGCVFNSVAQLIYTVSESERTALQAPDAVPLQFQSNLTDTNVLIYVGDRWGDGLTSNVNVFHYKGARKLTVIDDIFDMREQPFELSGYGSSEGTTNERGVWLKLSDVLAGDQLHFDLKEGDGSFKTELRLALYYKNSAGEFVTAWHRGTQTVITARHIITFDANRDHSYEEKMTVNGQIVDVIVGCSDPDAVNYNAATNREGDCAWTGTDPKTIIWGLGLSNMNNKTYALKDPPAGMSLEQVVVERLLTTGHSNAYVYPSGTSTLADKSGKELWEAKANSIDGISGLEIVSMSVVQGDKLLALESEWASFTLEYSSKNYIPIEVEYRGPAYDTISYALRTLYVASGLTMYGNLEQTGKCGLADRVLSTPGHIIHDNTLCAPADVTIPVMNRPDNLYKPLEGDVLLGLKLLDSYGDGWQAALVTLFSHPGGVEETKAGEFFTTGAVADRFFAVENDTVYKLVLYGGTWPNETALNIFNVVDGAFSGNFVDRLEGSTAGDKTTVRYFKMVNGVYKHMYIEIGLDGTETLKEGDLPDDNFTGKIQLVLGCIDSNATNYDPVANVDDGSCAYSAKTVAIIVEEEFNSTTWVHWQGGDPYLGAVTEIIDIQGVTADKLTLSVPQNKSLGSAYHQALPNWQYSTSMYFAQRITFEVPEVFDVSVSGTRLGNEATFIDSDQPWFARAVTDIVDVVDTGCTDLAAANFNLAAQADDGSCVYDKVVTVADGVFVIDGVAQPTLELSAGLTYNFTQADASNDTHQIIVKHGIATVSTSSGTPGTAGAYTTYTPHAEAENVTYTCLDHGAVMGGSITIV